MLRFLFVITIFFKRKNDKKAEIEIKIVDKIDNNLEDKNHKQYDSFNQNLHQVAKLLEQISKKNQENVSKTNEQLSALRKFSDEKNELVKKYQEFYDFGILKSLCFYFRFVILAVWDPFCRILFLKDFFIMGWSFEVIHPGIRARAPPGARGCRNSAVPHPSCWQRLAATPS